MRFTSTICSMLALGAWLGVSVPAFAQQAPPNAASIRRAQDDFDRLRSELARVNAEVAELKLHRSVGNDYRLRQRMADAEALAQRVSQAEARLRELGVKEPPKTLATPVTLPQASDEDGSLELEAKAYLFSDEAKKLNREAESLIKVAAELRSRRALRRKAGAWDRDPFAGLESSKRNLALSAPSAPRSTGTVGGESTRGNGSQSPTLSGGGTWESANPPATPVTDTGAVKGPTFAAADGSAVAKGPLSVPAPIEKQAVEQRLYLDPTAATARQLLTAPHAASDPEALERAAAVLRAKARQLDQQARALLDKSRAP